MGKDNFKNHQVVEWQLQWWVVNGSGSDDNAVLGLVASLLIVGEGWWQCSKDTSMMVVASIMVGKCDWWQAMRVMVAWDGGEE